MKKTYFKAFVMALLSVVSVSNASAAEVKTIDVPVKMTWVDYDNPTTAVGLVDQARAGYNKISDGKVDWGKTSWGENKVAYICVDATSVKDCAKTYSLSLDVSGSSDSKRTTGWGIGYNSMEWNDDLTFEGADLSITTIGDVQWTTTKSAAVFETKTWDISELVRGDEDGIITIVVYETAAAGGYIQNAKLVVGTTSSVETIDFEDEVAQFTAQSRCTVTVEKEEIGTTTEEIVDEETGEATTVEVPVYNNYLYMKCAGNAQNGYSLANLNLVDLFPNIERAEKVNVKMKYWSANGSRAVLFLRDATLAGVDGSNTGVAKNVYGNKYAWFRLGSDKNNGFIQNEANGDNLAKCTGQWLDLDVTVNVSDNTVDYVVKDAEGEVVFEATGTEPYSTQAGVEAPAKCSQIELWGFINNSEAFKLDNVEITVTEKMAEYANFTVKYVNAAGEEIAEAQTREGEVGEAAVLLATDENPIYAADNTAKYIYESNDAAEVIVAADGTSVVTVKFRDAQINNLLVQVNGTPYRTYEGVFEGDNYNFWMPYYIFQTVTPEEGEPYQGLFKLAAGENYTLSYAQLTITMPKLARGRNYSISVTYNEEENSDAVFYAEAEEIEGITKYQDGFTEIRMSNGAAGYAETEGTVVYTIAEDAQYKIEASSRSGNTSFSLDGKFILEVSSTGAVTTPTAVFSAKAGSTITVSAGDDKNYFDYVLIRKTGEYNSENDPTTSISTVNAAAVGNGKIYNLSGMEVNNAVKGVYIKNGKKFVVK